MVGRGNGVGTSRGSVRVGREALLRKALLGSTALVGVAIASPALAQTSANGGHVTSTYSSTVNGGGANQGTTAVFSGAGGVTVDGATINNTTGTPNDNGLHLQNSGGSGFGITYANNASTLTTTQSGGAAAYISQTGANLGISHNVSGNVFTGSYGERYASSGSIFYEMSGGGGSDIYVGNGTAVAGVHLTAGGFTSAAFNAPTISGFATGIYANGSQGASVSTLGGTISATGTGIYVTGAGVGVDSKTAITAPIGIDAVSTDGAGITTSGAGTINGGNYGIRSVVSAGTGPTVINVGAAIGGSTAPTTGVDARANGTSTGSVSITNTAAITATGNAIYTSSNATSGNVLNLNANVTGNGLAAVQAVGQGYTINVGAAATVTSGSNNGRTILVQSGDATLVNAGTISNTHATGNSAVQFGQAGNLTNTGSITTVGSAIAVSANTGLTLSNSGTIAAGGTGIYAGGTGNVSITNLSGGSITGNGGGGSTPAIALFNSGGGTNTLDLRAGSTTGGVTSIASGATTVTLAGTMTGNYSAGSSTGVNSFTLASTGSMQGATLGSANDVFNWNGGTIAGLSLIHI